MSEPAAIELPETACDGFDGIRRPARERFLSRGWPTRRDEAYKYTDLSALARRDWPRIETPGTAAPLPDALGTRVLWNDGFQADESAIASHVRSLRACAQSPERELAALLGRLAPSDDPMVALNTALFDHGAWIRLPQDTRPATPIELTYASGLRDNAAAAHARLALELGSHSQLVLVERHAGSDADTLSTRVAEIALAEGAQLLHIRLNEAGAGSRLLGHTSVRLAANAGYQFLNLDLGARLSREAVQVELAGEGASAMLHGLALLDGKRHADSDIKVLHSSGHTRSDQHFRGVLDGRSRSVYTGRVVVAKHAQKSDSAQQSANLLLSPRAEADTRPQLEIYADDVTCSHGAATGAVDPEALFYLQSRGLDSDMARRMVAYGFAADILNALGGHALQHEIAKLVAARMQAPQEVLEWL